jgi:hypothetical protein
MSERHKIEIAYDEERLQIIIKRGDHVRVYRDDVLTVEGRSMNDLVLAFCRFIDLSPLEIAANCKVIESQYQEYKAREKK